MEIICENCCSNDEVILIVEKAKYYCLRCYHELQKKKDVQKEIKENVSSDSVKNAPQKPNENGYERWLETVDQKWMARFLVY